VANSSNAMPASRPGPSPIWATPSQGPSQQRYTVGLTSGQYGFPLVRAPVSQVNGNGWYSPAPRMRSDGSWTTTPRRPGEF
jgi:hypothetical protein